MTLADVALKLELAPSTSIDDRRTMAPVMRVKFRTACDCSVQIGTFSKIISCEHLIGVSICSHFSRDSEVGAPVMVPL